MKVLQIMLAGSDLLGINHADPRNNVTDGNLTLPQHHQTTFNSHFKQPFGLRSLKKKVNSHSTAGWSWITIPQKNLSLKVTKRQNKIRSLKFPSMQKKKKVSHHDPVLMALIYMLLLYFLLCSATNKNLKYKIKNFIILNDTYNENLTK